MTQRVLVANRGEIAIRVIRACRDLGYTSIAVYSDADEGSEHVRLADESIRIGEAPASQSYLDSDRIIAAAVETHADAVHPGYGFLSENADFAERVVTDGFRWVGPPASIIRTMGDKAAARRAALGAGVPLVPGTDVIEGSAAALAAGEALGYPLLVKAVAGGGGKGIRLVAGPAELESAYDDARREVGAAFGNPDVYLERALLNVRHIEIQLLADDDGHVIHLFDRDCSLQRRRQKVVEEAPAPTLAADTRSAICESAVRLARSLGYVSAGTAEFLVDEEGGFYFIEMNTRIQVEHGVTELVTGIDIVAEQLRIAFGNKLSMCQEDVRMSGAAIEVRINAENPDFHFMGSPGTITQCVLPGGPGVRVDSGVTAGSIVQPYYDSMLAKVMTHGADRDVALARAKRALNELRIEGVITTTAFTRSLIEQDWFGAARYDTSTLESAVLNRKDS